MAPSWPGTTCRRCRRCSSPASASTPTPTSGPPRCSACPSSTTGGRPRPVGRSPRTSAASSRCPSSRGHRPCPCPGMPSPSSTSTAQPVPPGHEGAICIRLPLPPGTLPTLWQDDERYVAGYLSAFEGYYLTGDGGMLDEDGYLFVMGRTDDVLNVAGHRLSTGSIEAALAGHGAVAECAVIGVHDDFKGQLPRALVVLKSGVDGEGDGERIRAELVQAGPRGGGPRRRAPPGRHRGGPAQDEVGQDPAQDDARDRRRQAGDRARHDRGRLGARCAPAGAATAGVISRRTPPRWGPCA